MSTGNILEELEVYFGTIRCLPGLSLVQWLKEATQHSDADVVYICRVYDISVVRNMVTDLENIARAKWTLLY